jgi:hypothetical protein
MFRNMTTDVVRKQCKKRTNNPTRIERIGDDSRQQTFDLAICNTQRNSLHTPVLLPCLTERATNFFFRQYVCDALQSDRFPTGPRGNHEYLPVLYARSPPGGMFTSIVEIVSLASLAISGNVSDWTNHVYKLYGMAINKIRDALLDPARVRTDEMVAAVMLMGTFEVGQN